MALEQQQQSSGLLAALYAMDRAFEPTAYFDAEMDQLVYLRTNAPNRADRVDARLTFFWAADRMELVGIKIKGVRSLFNQLRARGLLRADQFVPMCEILSGIMRSAVDGPVDAYQKKFYDQASMLVGDSKFDASAILAA